MFSTYRHNKKRNVGLLREFFSRYMARAIVENRINDFNQAKTIWTKYFNPKTKIYEEYKAYAALYDTNISNREMGIEILRRVKSVCSKQDQSRLDKEKTSLLAEITRLRHSETFFEQSIPNYKALATTQVLINAWRGTGNVVGDIAEMVKLEESVLSNLVSDAKVITEGSKVISSIKPADLINTNKEKLDSLALKIFFEKFNEKYSSLLIKEQMELLSSFLLHNHDNVVTRCKRLTEDSLKEISMALKDSSYPQTLKNKLQEVNQQIFDRASDLEGCNVVSEDSLAFFMSLCPLIEELKSKDEVKQTNRLFDKEARRSI